MSELRRRVTTEEKTSSKKMSIFKVVLLGSSGVGKSNLLSRLNGKGFTKNFADDWCEFLTKIIEVDDDVKVKAQIWDTAGKKDSVR